MYIVFASVNSKLSRVSISTRDDPLAKVNALKRYLSRLAGEKKTKIYYYLLWLERLEI